MIEFQSKMKPTLAELLVVRQRVCQVLELRGGRQQNGGGFACFTKMCASPGSSTSAMRRTTSPTFRQSDVVSVHYHLKGTETPVSTHYTVKWKTPVWRK